MAITPRFLRLAAGRASSSNRPLREALRAICTQSRSCRSMALAITVSICRVQISHAQINRVIEDRQGALFVLVHKEATAAAESKNRDLCPGSAKSPRGKKIGFQPRAGNILQ